MRRADRLFDIVHTLRGRRLTTAAQLAEWLEVSERTIYRDIADLIASGMPIEGEAGVGYRLHHQFELPPMMFTHNEIDALVAGAKLISAWGSDLLTSGARSALSKISAALPPDKRQVLENSPIHAPRFHVDARVSQHMDDVRRAIAAQRIVRLHYEDADGATSERLIHPLGLFYWGNRWTMAAWCELRADYRTFRLDRIASLQVTDQSSDSHYRLDDYLQVQCPE